MVQEFSSQGTLSPTLAAQVTGGPSVPPAIRNSLIAEGEGQPLLDAIVRREREKGRDEQTALKIAQYILQTIALNTELMAEKYGLPYDGTAEGFRQVMRGITQAILEGIAGLGVGEQETQDIIQDGGTYVVALNTDQVLGWTSEVLEGFGEEDFSLIEEQSLLANKRNEVMHWPISRLVADLTSLYADPDVHTMPVLGGQTIRDDTLAGRIFHGFYQNAFSMPREQLRTLALEAERLMGVNAYAIMARSRSHDPYTFRRALANVFSSAGYGHILNADVLTPGALAGVHVTREKYSDADKYIHIHFDLQQQPGVQIDWAQQFDHGTVSLLDASGQMIGDIPALRFIPAQAGLYISVPLNSVLIAAGGQSLLDKPFTLRVNLVKQDGSRIAGEDQTHEFHIELKGVEDLSTTRNDAHKKLIEDTVLSRVKSNFPVRNPSDWRWDITSGYHNGPEYHAADLNLGGGNNDYGQPVVPIADGTAQVISVKSGIVRIRHETPLAGHTEPIIWYTQMDHIPIEEEAGRYFVRRRALVQVTNADGSLKFDQKGRPVMDFVGNVIFEREIVNGQTIKAADYSFENPWVVVGKNGTGSAHLHLEIRDAALQSIDMRKLLADRAQFGMLVKAYDWGANGISEALGDDQGFQVRWDDDVNNWVVVPNKDGNPWLIYDRSGQQPDVSDKEARPYFMAWHVDLSQRKKVVFKFLEFINDNGIRDTKGIWVDANDDNRRWSPGKRKFVDRTNGNDL